MGLLAVCHRRDPRGRLVLRGLHATPAAGWRGGGETREERDAGQHVHRASGGGETRERYRAAGGGRAFLRVEASEEDGGEVGAAAGDRRGDGEGMGT